MPVTVPGNRGTPMASRERCATTAVAALVTHRGTQSLKYTSWCVLVNSWPERDHR